MRGRFVPGLSVRLRANAASEAGQSLVVVLFITMILMALVITATTATAAQVVPSRQAIDAAAALAAAQGGIDDFIAEVNAECETPGSCAWIAGNPSRSATPLSGGRATVKWTVRNAATYIADGFVRIESTGTINAGDSDEEKRTVIADVAGAANLLDYLFYTRYETQSAASVTAHNPARTIPLTGELSGLDYSPVAALDAGSDVHWSGAGSSADYPAVSACDHTWYDTADGDGRATLRYDAGVSDPGDFGADWGEVGDIDGAALTRAGACEVSFSSGSVMNGRVYSEDALLISSSVAGGAGPLFRDIVETGWSSSDTPAADAGKTYRTVPQLPGSTPALGSEQPVSALTGPVLPEWDQASAEAAALCVYTGPTRIRIDGATAIVTSPLTVATGASACYTSHPSAASATAPLVGGQPSVLEARVPYAGWAIAVKNASGAGSLVHAPQNEDTARTAANSLFLATGAAVAGSTTADPQAPYAIGTWTPKWTVSPNLQSRFETEAGKTYAAFKTAAQTAVTGANTTTTALGAALTGAITTAFNGKQVATQTGGILSSTGRTYTTDLSTVVTTGPTRTGAGTTSYGTDTGVLSDPLLDGSSARTGFVDTTVRTVTATVSRQPVKCSVLAALGGCIGTWNNDGAAVQQFTVTATATSTARGQTTVQLSAFPLPSDRTGYATRSGDAYVEGTVTGTLSIAAQGDVVVTDDVRHASGSTPTVPITELPYFTSSDAVVLAANRNVLLYHPVACVSDDDDAIAETTAGFCPDDLTGLYDGGMTGDTFTVAHPSRQYDSLVDPVSTVDAAIYAINGSFELQNYDRGAELGVLSVGGGIYQEHRGITGVEWEITTGTASRPRSGYTLDYRHDRTLSTKAVPWAPTAVGAVSGRIWNLQGYSEG
jgi:hypothetical protein